MEGLDAVSDRLGCGVDGTHSVEDEFYLDVSTATPLPTQHILYLVSALGMPVLDSHQGLLGASYYSYLKVVLV
jgi:hypothetical protein